LDQPTKNKNKENTIWLVLNHFKNYCQPNVSATEIPHGWLKHKKESSVRPPIFVGEVVNGLTAMLNFLSFTRNWNRTLVSPSLSFLDSNFSFSNQETT
jgi:hypothetical protein